MNNSETAKRIEGAYGLPAGELEGTPQAAEWAKLREKEQEKLREERKKKAAAEDVDGQLRLL